jgi:hypothetical protein
MNKQLFQAHPWHGVTPGTPDLVNAYIEIVPTDAVKYELDKTSGHPARRSPAALLVHVANALWVHTANVLWARSRRAL